MSRRHVETITDYVVVAVSPTLIIFLVSSLVFFLSHLFYDGDFPGRLRFASGLFVMAAVLIARISIEEGREYASLFALPLCVVTVLSMLKYTDASLLLILPLVAFVWWSTDKLTWDCTVIHDHEDTSGEGLLTTLSESKGPSQDTNPNELDTQATTEREKATGSLWARFVAHRRRQHTPGVWVLYFGAAGILVFGMGQLLLSPAARPAGFMLLCIYVASTLSLLMTTSFLQMRRYLIQRRLPFTDQMASVWLGTGGVLIVGLMLLALVLPRPHTGYSLLEKFDRVAQQNEARERRASRFGMGPEGVEDEDVHGSGSSERSPDQESPHGQARDEAQQTRAGDRPDEDGQDSSQGSSSQSDSSQGSRSEGSDSQSADRGDRNNDRGDRSDDRGDRRGDRGDRRDDRGAPQRGDDEGSSHAEQRQDQQDSSDTPAKQSSAEDAQASPPPPPAHNPLANLSFGKLARWIYLLVIGGLILFALLRYGKEIGAALSAFMAELRDLLARLFGGGRRPRLAEDLDLQVEVSPPPKPFSAYQDPFLMGTDGQFTGEQLVNYTFEALEAWALERDCPRDEGQTPLEFVSAVGKEHQHLQPLAQNLAILYNQAAYAPGTLPGSVKGHLRSLWGALRSPAHA